MARSEVDLPVVVHLAICRTPASAQVAIVAEAGVVPHHALLTIGGDRPTLGQNVVDIARSATAAGAGRRLTTCARLPAGSRLSASAATGHAVAATTIVVTARRDARARV